MDDKILDSITRQINELEQEIENPDSECYHTNQFRSHVIQRLESDEE